VGPFAIALFVGASSTKGYAQEEAPCVTGLVLDVTDAEATAITTTFCQSARARHVTGPLRVAVMALGDHVRVTATQTDPTTGAEHAASLGWNNVTEAARDAGRLAASFDERTPAVPPSPPVPSPPAPPAAARVREERREADETTFVTLRSPKGTQLQRMDETGRWSTACISPCALDVPRTGSYRVVDEGHPLPAFRLDTTRSAATVEVRPRSTVADVIAAGLVAAGGISFWAGALGSNDSRSSSSGALLGVGLVGMVAGGLTFLLNSSDVSVNSTDRSTAGGNRP
jgi:hypothetical protein